MNTAQMNRYTKLYDSLRMLPHINEDQAQQWVGLQKNIDSSRDYLLRAVPDAQHNLDEAQKILSQRTYTLVFFGGTGVGKSSLINSLLGRNLLPTGAVTAVTGTIVYIEQALEGEAESLSLSYWSKDELKDRTNKLADLAKIDSFDISDKKERSAAHAEIIRTLEENRDQAKTERDEYLEILLDCISSYENNQALYKNKQPAPQLLSLNNPQSLDHLREDSFKGSDERQIRLIRSATFKIHPRKDQPNLLMNGYLRIVDVPGLGAGMKLHEAITLEEMKREDAMIVLVTDAGRQRVDEMKSMASVHWIKDYRLRGLSGVELDEAAAKIFMVVNGGNVRQAFDRLNSGSMEGNLEVKELTRHIAPNYWQRYSYRGKNRPYFLTMPPAALYVQDPEHAPAEFAGETERILKLFRDELGGISENPLDPESSAALLKLSEIPQLRQSLIQFIEKERVPLQLREAGNRVRLAVQSLRYYYEKQLTHRGVQPPFNLGWESLQERRFENLLKRMQKDLPRLLHNALLDLNNRYNGDQQFRQMLKPTLDSIRGMVEEKVQREIEILLESYGTEYWDSRDVTYDNLIWNTSGIEVPIKRILYQVELAMQEAVSQFIPEIADVVAGELERSLDTHEISSRLYRAGYGQAYNYSLPNSGDNLTAVDAYHLLIRRIRDNFREICRQATMYELVRPERSIHYRIESGVKEITAQNDVAPEDERLLDVVLTGVGQLRERMMQAVGPRPNNNKPVAVPAKPAEDEFEIRILDQDVVVPATPVTAKPTLEEELQAAGVGMIERSYNSKLDTIGVKTNQIFKEILNDLFSDDDLLPRLHRLFWLEVTKAERDYNNLIVKPLLRQHDRNLQNATLRTAMEMDLESLSDVQALMRQWEGLDKLERGFN